ncbi:MAG: hypothetical protein LLG00_01070 [Planctomycetaceae bacterium]|nr:hypothetical protein [Planctomycetaceae bacterium]
MRLSNGILWMTCVAFTLAGPVMEVSGQQTATGPATGSAVQPKSSTPDPLVPGKWLTTSDERRNQSLEEIKKIAAKSKADIEPIQSQHVTLWAAKDHHRTYLPDIEKLEKFFHTRCAEPIRSGLDKRSAHIVLLKDRAEFEAWCRAIFDLSPQRFPNASFREEAIKRPAIYTPDMAWVSLEDKSADQAHHDAVAGVGIMYFSQLAKPGPFVFGPLQTGFVNWAEATVFGSPAEMFHAIVYRSSNPAEDGRNWGLLVRQRLMSHKATPLGELLQMDSSNMWHPHYAEAWTLVELLASQPVKFGKLLLALRKTKSELAAINEVYGWDEKRLTKEWRGYAMTHGVKAKK